MIFNHLYQKATYWAPGAVSGFGGRTFSAPVTIRVRWEDRAELFIDADGNEVRSRSIVYSDISVKQGGYLFLGESTATDPTTVNNAYEIRDVTSTPNLYASTFLYKIVL